MVIRSFKDMVESIGTSWVSVEDDEEVDIDDDMTEFDS